MNVASLKIIVAAKCKLVFVLTQETLTHRVFILKPSERTFLFPPKTVLGIFKLALRLRDRHIFKFRHIRQSLEIIHAFKTLTLMQVFWKTKIFLKNFFLVESTTIESTIFQYKTCHAKT